MNDVYYGLDLVGVLLEDHSLVFRHILLALETRDTLFLVLSDAVHLFPDLVFLTREFRLLSLLVKLGEVLIDAAIEGVIGKILV